MQPTQFLVNPCIPLPPPYGTAGLEQNPGRVPNFNGTLEQVEVLRGPGAYDPRRRVARKFAHRSAPGSRAWRRELRNAAAPVQFRAAATAAPPQAATQTAAPARSDAPPQGSTRSPDWCWDWCKAAKTGTKNIINCAWVCGKIAAKFQKTEVAPSPGASLLGNPVLNAVAQVAGLAVRPPVPKPACDVAQFRETERFNRERIRAGMSPGFVPGTYHLQGCSKELRDREYAALQRELPIQNPGVALTASRLRNPFSMAQARVAGRATAPTGQRGCPSGYHQCGSTQPGVDPICCKSSGGQGFAYLVT